MFCRCIIFEKRIFFYEKVVAMTFKRCVVIMCNASATMIHESHMIWFVTRKTQRIKSKMCVASVLNLMTVELTCIQTLPYAICIAAAVRMRDRKWQLPLIGQWISVQEVSDACGYCSPFFPLQFLRRSFFFKFAAKQPGCVHWIFVLVLLASCCSRDLLEPVKPAGPAAPPPPLLHPA